MSDTFPAAFNDAIAQFNGGEYYACHDTLEALWMDAVDPDRSFYQGLLQVAVALYHLGNGNGRGAAILLGEGIGRLRDFQPEYGGIDVAAIVAESFALLTALQQEGIDNSDRIVERLQSDTETLRRPTVRKVSA